jgi:hypothetical protein
VKQIRAYEISTWDKSTLFKSHAARELIFTIKGYRGIVKNLSQISTVEVMTVLIGFQFTAASKLR